MPHRRDDAAPFFRPCRGWLCFHRRSHGLRRGLESNAATAATMHAPSDQIDAAAYAVLEAAGVLGTGEGGESVWVRPAPVGATRFQPTAQAVGMGRVSASAPAGAKDRGAAWGWHREICRIGATTRHRSFAPAGAGCVFTGDPTACAVG